MRLGAGGQLQLGWPAQNGLDGGEKHPGASPTGRAPQHAQASTCATGLDMSMSGGRIGKALPVIEIARSTRLRVECFAIGARTEVSLKQPRSGSTQHGQPPSAPSRRRAAARAACHAPPGARSPPPAASTGAAALRGCRVASRPSGASPSPRCRCRGGPTRCPTASGRRRHPAQREEVAELAVLPAGGELLAVRRVVKELERTRTTCDAPSTPRSSDTDPRAGSGMNQRSILRVRAGTSASVSTGPRVSSAARTI